MIIAYGYNRTVSDLKKTGAEKMWIDTPKTKRAERNDMMKHGTRSGDTLAVLALSDLGRGSEAKAFKAAVEAVGVSVLVVDIATPKGKPGAPRKFNPSPDQDTQIKNLYRSFLFMAHVLERATDIMGHEVKRHHLTHRYGGKRWPTQ